MKRLIINTFVLIFLSIPIVWAQEFKKKPKEVEIGKVVITATRTERPVKDVPNSVTIITKEEIEATSARYVDDLLRNMVGVNHNS